MKRVSAIVATVMALSITLIPSALAAEAPATNELAQVCYPSSVTVSEDNSEIRKMYDLSPEDNPAGIPRSDFEQDGYHYTLIELLKQELPEHESRMHVETISVESKNKDMESVLALLPQEKELITDDGFTGTLTLSLESVQIEVAGYASYTKNLSATRNYPNLASQDTQYIPKTIEDNGKTLTLQNIDWQTDNTATVDSYALADRYTAVATYTGTTTGSYVKGYTVTADYIGTVERIALNKVRYVAIYEGTAIEPEVPEVETPVVEEPDPFNWAYILIPLGVIAVAGGGIGVALAVKRRNETDDEEDS